MTQQTSVKIIETIEKSGLLSAEELQRAGGEFESKVGVDPDADGGAPFLDHLVSAGLLTTWQREKLAQGRHRGFILGNYKLLRRIGSGGMSTVYLAEHVHMRQRRALKILPAARVGDSSYLERFYREARAAAALDHHNIVHAYDVGSDGGTHYFVMEYVEGSDLQKTVAKRGVLSYESAADVIRQTALGLAQAHKAGVIHRDIKPANLLVDAEGTVKILDMGLARFTPEEIEQQASLTQMHDENVIGTTNYLSPEQALNSHKADGRADIYSLGCTLYYLLTGKPPFSTGSVAQRLMAHLHKDPEPITAHRPGVPASLAAICRKMMAKKPADRYQTALELAAAMKSWQQEWSSSAGAKTPSGLKLGTRATDDEGVLEADPGSAAGSLRDTDVVRGQTTSLSQGPNLDDDLQLADLDDLPKGSGVRKAKPTRARATSGGSSPSHGGTGGTKRQEPQAVVEQTAPANDFLAEILAAAPPASPPPSPPAQLQRPAALARYNSPRQSVRTGSSSVHDDSDIKQDVERLFRRHPGFAALVFLFFSGLLVFGLYYMIRPSEDASTNPTTTTGIGASRD